VKEGVDSTVNTPPNQVTLRESFLERIVSQPLVLTATIRESPFIEGVPVRFVVTGANPRAVEVLTDGAGEAHFEYKGENPGEDHIRASIISEGKEHAAELTATWLVALVEVEEVGTRPPHPPNRPGAPGPPVHSPAVLVQAEGVGPPRGKLVGVSTVSGTVLVKGTSGARFTLKGEQLVPVGSEIDTTRGVVRLSTLTHTGVLQTAEASGGAFKVIQRESEHGLTELDIVDSRSPTQCRVGQTATIGRLNLSDRGAFTVRGRSASASSVRAVLSVADRCDGTFTLDTRGAVSVRDFAGHKTVELRTGQRYLAAAR
jgi:hypothetical protein